MTLSAGHTTIRSPGPSDLVTACIPETDLEALVQTLCELGRVDCLHDLGTRGPLVASAGAHSLFHCLFGRDAIRMGMDLLDDFPQVARTTLLELARLQGVKHNVRGEEEPGRILHEHRHPQDVHATALAERWDFPYYGAVDTTPQWINLLGQYCTRYGNDLLDASVVDRSWRTVTLRDSLLAALEWIVRRLDDPIAGGYLWVRRAYEHGIANQVWEDSFDSYYHADGTLFDHRRAYAPVAVQGYAYDALLTGADLLAEMTSLPFDPEWLRARAARLRALVLSEFWQADLGTFAMALTVETDGLRRPARVIASTAGHLLASRLLDGDDVAEMRARLVARLLEPDLLAPGGIRTKSTSAARFRAGSYHNGSVWPMDTGVIADGLRRHGRIVDAAELEQRVLDACRVTGMFPEFFRGDVDGVPTMNSETVDALVDGVANRLEQPPQTHQGWTTTRVWRILRQRGDITWPPATAESAGTRQAVGTTSLCGGCPG
jgi:glycogen debranching enzyme